MGTCATSEPRDRPLSLFTCPSPERLLSWLGQGWPPSMPVLFRPCHSQPWEAPCLVDWELRTSKSGPLPLCRAGSAGGWAAGQLGEGVGWEGPGCPQDPRAPPTCTFALTLASRLSVVGCCIFAFFVGMLFVQRSGNYFVTMFDDYSATLPLTVIVILENIAVAWIYGTKK